MSSTNVRPINIEFYVSQDVQIENVCIITLFRKVHTEVFYESEEMVNNFEKDEDLFISWLASISSSNNYPLVRALIKNNGYTVEALYSSIKSNYVVNFPYLSKVRRIYVIQKLKPQEGQLSVVSVGETTTEVKERVAIAMSQDFSYDDLYLFYSPIILRNQLNAEAVVIETDRGVILLRTGEINHISTMSTAKKSSKKVKKRKSGKKKGRRSRRAAKSSS